MSDLCCTNKLALNFYPVFTGVFFVKYIFYYIFSSHSRSDVITSHVSVCPVHMAESTNKSVIVYKSYKSFHY